MDLIKIPRRMFQAAVEKTQRPDLALRVPLDLCVKIPYKGFTLSVATDARTDTDDFTGESVRVYHGEKDLTELFLPMNHHLDIVASGEMLKVAFDRIDVFLHDADIRAKQRHRN